MSMESYFGIAMPSRWSSTDRYAIRIFMCFGLD